VVGEVSAAQLSDAIEVLHDDGSELSDDEQIRLRGVMAAQGLPVTEAQRKAADARALVAAFRAANPEGSPPDDPEVEWDQPDTEEEAASDLAVAYLGGQFAEARSRLNTAEYDAKREIRAAMREAALLGRKAWREAHQ
jgi:hypothetical protein